MKNKEIQFDGLSRTIDNAVEKLSDENKDIHLDLNPLPLSAFKMGLKREKKRCNSINNCLPPASQTTFTRDLSEDDEENGCQIVHVESLCSCDQQYYIDKLNINACKTN